MYEAFNEYFEDRIKRDMNKEVAKLLLFDVCDLLDARGVSYFLAFGTLLGAVRDHDLISYDTDVDLGGLTNDHPIVKDICESSEFRTKELVLARSSRDLITIMRDGEHLDLYLFAENTNEYRCMNFTIPLEQLKDGFSQLTFLGREFNTVRDPESDLRWRYGKKWRIPKQGFHAKR